MSKYTTGEMAKLCGVTVRTVQYYDSRGILIPSDLSEGGRRLYSEEDLQRMKVICFLRGIGLPINSIGELLSDEEPEKVINLLLDQQSSILKSEIAERQEKLDTLVQIKRRLKDIESFSVESMGDIAYILERRKKLRKVRITMLAVGIVMDIIEIATLALWIVKGIWLPFVVGMCIVIAVGIWVSKYYFDRVDYICPQCHTIFKPSFKEAFFANHTPNTRKLTCTSCGKKCFCVETYSEEEKQ